MSRRPRRARSPRRAELLRTLEEVVRDALARGQSVLDVITQDEYTHDVVVSSDDGQFLVYDTT